MKAFIAKFYQDEEIVVIADDENHARFVAKQHPPEFNDYDIEIHSFTYIPNGWDINDTAYGSDITLKEAMEFSPEYQIELERHRDKFTGQKYFNDWLERR